MFWSHRSKKSLFLYCNWEPEEMPQNVCTVHEDKAYLQAQKKQKMKDIGLDKKNILALNCKYYLTHQF